MSHYKHWKFDIDENERVWLGLDRAGESVNTINHEVLDELNSLLQDVDDRKNATGLIIYSCKEKGFIAGADIHLFSQFKSTDLVLEFLRKGQLVLSRLASLSIPTLAMIDGFCMGGGFELSLACDYRIASDDAQTRLGLPEVMLGFPPGWGGTVRLPQLIGGFNALTQMILTGRTFAAKKAKYLGVVDDVMPKRQLRRAACHYIDKKPAKHQPGFMARCTNYKGIRSVLATLIYYSVSKRVNGEHYPAPFAIIDLWEKEGGRGERAYSQETHTVQKLISTGQTAKNLIRTFLLQDRLKTFSKTAQFKAKSVHVIGAGTMGGDIAAWCALCGLNVTVQDRSIENMSGMVARAHKLFKKKLKSPLLVQAAIDRLVPDVEGIGVAQADVIIEAVFENLNVKREIFKQVEAKAKKEAIIASNTSSIPLEQIAEALNEPSRLVGIHFFNPVAQMMLVEVVGGEQTSEQVKDAANAFVGQIKKLPLPVKSSPGFLINRVLMPYLMAAVNLIQEGVKPERVDQAALKFGMRMGPVELADAVGLDVCLAVAENLTASYGGMVPKMLREKVKQGHLGRKSGQGFYAYKKGKAVKAKCRDSEVQDHWVDRLIEPLIDEAKHCLDEGVVQDSDLLDAGMIFATGFAPFRGGPMKYAAEKDTHQKHEKGMSLKLRAKLLGRIHDWV